MNQSGYTLVETLVAIAILAMAIGGLTWGIQVFGRWEALNSAEITQAQTLRSAQAGVARVLAGAGPFRSDVAGELAGDGQGFSFACGQASNCAVSLETVTASTGLKIEDGRGGVRHLPLQSAQPAQFVYRSAAGAGAAWPPAGARQVLRTIALVSTDPTQTPVLQAHVWPQQPAVCAFDDVAQDCR